MIMNRTHDGWIYTKTQKFEPDKRLQLGQIIVKPFQPEYALMAQGPRPIPDDFLVDETSVTEATLAVNREAYGRWELWAKLNNLPIGIGMEGGSNKLNEAFWTFARLTSKQISPSIPYVEESLQHGDVPAYVRSQPWYNLGQKLFLVTGVTIAEGAHLVTRNSQEADVKVSAAADASGAGLGKAKVAGQLSSKAETKAAGSFSDFVFAYTLNEINYRKITHQPFRSGEVSSVGDAPEDDTAAAMVDDIVVDSINEDFYRGGDK